MRNSKRIKSNPFGKRAIEILPITQHEDGRTVWFAKMPITTDTNPVDLQALQRKQARITGLIFVAANVLARERNIQPDDARKLFFPQKQEDGTETVPLEFIKYLTDSQIEEFLVLQEEAFDLPVVCATMFLRHRLAFELHITGVAADGFKIDFPWYDINVGDRFNFGGNIASVAHITDEMVQFNAGATISVGSTGFLIDSNGDYVLGDTSWTEDQTKSMLSIAQVHSIYRFYEDCLNNRQSTDSAEVSKSETNRPETNRPETNGNGAEGNGTKRQSNDSEPTLTPPLLIGGEMSIPNVAL